MAKKQKLSTYQRRLKVARDKKRAITGKKIAAKLKGRKQSRETKNKLARYRELLKSYVEKQKSLGKKITYRKADGSKEMRQLLKDLRSNDPFLKKKALKQTTRRDGVPDIIPVGETPSVYSEAA